MVCKELLFWKFDNKYEEISVIHIIKFTLINNLIN
jgi:hypothetical protein